MTLTDIILIIILLFGAFRGFQKGFILEIVSFFAFFLAILGGFKLLDLGISLLEPYRENLGSFLPVAAFIVVFVLILIALNVAGRIFKKIIHFTFLGSFDSLAGAVVGILKIALFLSILNWGFVKMGFEFPEKLSEESFIYAYIAVLAPKVGQLFIAIFPSFDNLFEKVGNFLKSISH